MAVRTQDCTKEYLTSVALPTHAESYTVISHEFIINHTMEQLALHGFSVEKETYRANSDGSIAQGVYYLNYTKDPEVGLMFAWSNSYNKLMRFKCAIGGYVFICMNGVVAGDMGSWGRKHLGSADTETVKAIIEQISNADIHFDRIVADKDVMKKITITERKQAELLGILYAEYEILTSEQMSIVKQQMDKPSYDYNCELNSLWAFYNHVTHALKKAHPRDWMDDQRKLHWFIAIEFDLVNFIEDGVLLPMDELELNYGEPKNQLNILTEIEKAEEDAEFSQLAQDANDFEEFIANEMRESIIYEDPAGNTFEVPVVPTTDQIIFEGLKAADEAIAERKEKTIDASNLIGTYTGEEMPALLEKIQDKIDNFDTIEPSVEVEEVKPTETKIVDDFDFDFDDIKEDNHGGEFFL
jgi:hypothetical protein